MFQLLLICSKIRGSAGAFIKKTCLTRDTKGLSWVNQKTGANDYVRKHNPGILFNSVTENPARLEKIKNTTLFYEDLKNNQLPQWMFITPNMTSDGHDTSVTTAGVWLKDFLAPLLADKNFMQNTLVLITFDENETYTIQNRVFSILIGDAVPASKVGTTDSNTTTTTTPSSPPSKPTGVSILSADGMSAQTYSPWSRRTLVILCAPGILCSQTARS